MPVNLYNTSKELVDHEPPIQKPLADASLEVIAYVNTQAAKGLCTPITNVSWYNPASTPEHCVDGSEPGTKAFPDNLGCSVDFMTTDTKTQDIMNDYLWANRVRLGICWIISRRRIRSTSPGHSGNWENYTGYNPHTDHTHVNFGHLVGGSGYSVFPVLPYKPLTPTPSKLVTMWSNVEGIQGRKVTYGAGPAGKVVTNHSKGTRFEGTWIHHVEKNGQKVQYLRTVVPDKAEYRQVDLIGHNPG